MRRPLVLSLLLALSIVTLGGCFHQRDEVKQVESLSYLRFIGHVEGAVVTVSRDGTAVMSDVVVAPQTSYTVRPGTYLVTVVRGGAEVVRRKLYVSDGHTVEVRIP